MSLSSITSPAASSVLPAARAGGAHPVAGRRETPASQDASGGAPAGARQLRSALSDTLAATAGGSADLGSDAVRDALGDFTGELFDALRAEGGREVGHGPGRHLQRGHAWGHYRGGDLAARIEALAATLGAGSTAPAEPAPPADTAPVDAVTDGVVQAAPEPATTEPAETAPSAAEAPAQPAVASPLEASFAALWQALNPEAGDAAGADLAQFLNALAERLGAGEPVSVGGLVDTTA
jgi:hypothetical protein